MIHVEKYMLSEADVLCVLKYNKYSSLFSLPDGVCKVRKWPICVPNKPLTNVWIYDQLHPQAQTPTREIYDEQCFGKLHHFIGNVCLSLLVWHWQSLSWGLLRTVRNVGGEVARFSEREFRYLVVGHRLNYMTQPTNLSHTGAWIRRQVHLGPVFRTEI